MTSSWCLGHSCGGCSSYTQRWLVLRDVQLTAGASQHGGSGGEGHATDDCKDGLGRGVAVGREGAVHCAEDERTDVDVALSRNQDVYRSLPKMNG
jgi:hypothetical protein